MTDRRPPVDAATWTEIRRRYDETAESLSSIARSYGLVPSTVTKHAKRHQWPPRTLPRGSAPVPESRDAGASGTPPDEGPVQVPSLPLLRREPDTLVVRVQRMLRLIDMQIDTMEKTMMTAEPATAQDQERYARAMSGVLNNMDRVGELIATVQPDGKTKDGEGGDADAGAEARRLREEIALRLERLNAQWLARPNAE